MEILKRPTERNKRKTFSVNPRQRIAMQMKKKG